MKETFKKFVARWQKGEPHPLTEYISSGKISYGETIQASWQEIEPLLKGEGYLLQSVTGVNQLGPDMHFYGVPAEKAPQRDGEYHVFLQLKESILYVGTMYIYALYRPLDALCCNMHGWKTELILS